MFNGIGNTAVYKIVVVDLLAVRVPESAFDTFRIVFARVWRTRDKA